jgi:hypothetical protein
MGRGRDSRSMPQASCSRCSQSRLFNQNFLSSISFGQNIPRTACFGATLFRVPSRWPPEVSDAVLTVPCHPALPLLEAISRTSLSLSRLVVDEFFFLPGGFSVPQAAVAPRFAAPCCQTAAASNVLLPTAASSSGCASPASRPSSLIAIAGWSRSSC